MRYIPTQLTPVPRPELADARILAHNLGLDASVVVAVGTVGFQFRRTDDGDFVGGEAITIGRGSEIDELWLTAARSVAVACLSKALRELGSTDAEEPSETISCAECGRILSSPRLVDFSGRPRVVSCGPAHVISAPGMVSLTFNPDGTTSWFVPVSGETK